eukprot:538561-Pelagomonas_calceolata.AAC.1
MYCSVWFVSIHFKYARAMLIGQNTGGTVKKGQGASTDQDSSSAQGSTGNESNTGPSQEVWDFWGIYRTSVPSATSSPRYVPKYLRYVPSIPSATWGC